MAWRYTIINRCQCGQVWNTRVMVSTPKPERMSQRQRIEWWEWCETCSPMGTAKKAYTVYGP